MGRGKWLRSRAKRSSKHADDGPSEAAIAKLNADTERILKETVEQLAIARAESVAARAEVESKTQEVESKTQELLEARELQLKYQKLLEEADQRVEAAAAAAVGGDVDSEFLISREDGEGIFTRSTDGVTWNQPGKPWHGTKWMNAKCNSSELRKIVGMLFEMLWGRIEKYDGPMPTAVEIVEDLIANMGTCVLATVMAAGWRLTWLLSAISVVIKSYASTGLLLLHCVKGGKFVEAGEDAPLSDRLRVSHCDCEVFWFCLFMREIPHVMVLLDGYVDSDDGNTIWMWSIPRPDGAEPYTVNLTVWDDAAKIDTDNLREYMLPVMSRATSPNLQRVCVLSAPVKSLEQDRVDEVLNQKLLEAMDRAKTFAEEKGFF